MLLTQTHSCFDARESFLVEVAGKGPEKKVSVAENAKSKDKSRVKLKVLQEPSVLNSQCRQLALRKGAFLLLREATEVRRL